MIKDFEYIDTEDIYLDSACQSLRPTPVIDALLYYYQHHNSCGDRVKYKWGVNTDDKVNQTRELVLKYLKLSSRDHFVSFTLNTTYAINLILSQINSKHVAKVMTSDMEHNSPFLSTIAYSKKNDVPREVMIREPDGSINTSGYDFRKALVVVSSTSNIDGRRLKNIDKVIDSVHRAGGVIIIDAAQTMPHSVELLHKTKADVVCFSAHKLYAPSLGGMVVRKDFLDKIDSTFIGGGMVDDVLLDTYKLSYGNPNHVHTVFEAGLQASGEIVALGAAIQWLMGLSNADHSRLDNNADRLYSFLASKEKIALVNNETTPTISFYVKGIDSHLLGAALADEHIMARTGYFCAHYYLDHVKSYPPLIRFSLGYHNSSEDIDKVIRILERVVK